MGRLGKNGQWVAISAALAVVTTLAYWKALGSGFVFDDKLYILTNPHVQNGLNWADIRWAFTTWYASNWHPLTWISHMLDNQIWGLSSFGYHLTNLLLHIANTVLLFHILRRMTGHLWRSAFVAALFALHPLHVESVAWIAERKDVLSTLFWLLTMLAYLRYTERPGIGRYTLVAVLFALGLMCKPMLVTLPIMLLLMDYWPLGRLDISRRGGLQRPPAAGGRRSTAPTDAGRPLKVTTDSISRSDMRKASPTALALEKITLLILTAGSCVVTYLAQRASGSVALNEFPFTVRAANAAVSSAAYLWKMVVPTGLAALYPHSGATLPVWQVIASVALLAGITALAIGLARRAPYLTAGWFWYIVTLIPVIGLVQVGSQAMADRYTYVPLVGIFMVIAYGGVGVWEYGRKTPDTPTHPYPHTPILACLILAACAFGTWHQTGFWKDELTLCRRALAVTTGNAMMHNNLGVALYEHGDLDGAIAEYRKGLAISTSYADLYVNYGNALCDNGDLAGSVVQYEKAIKLDPRNPQVYNNLGTVLEQQKKIDDAIDTYRKAIELDPSLSAPHTNLGHALIQIGQLDEAVTEYRTVIDLEPGSAEAHMNLGEALMGLGSADEAIGEFEQALWIKPDYPEAHLNMGVALINQGRPDDAIQHYQQALKSRPEYAEAHHNMAVALYSKGDYVGAWKEIGLCRKYGVAPNPDFIAELSSKMPEPR